MMIFLTIVVLMGILGIQSHLRKIMKQNDRVIELLEDINRRE
ncbi:hypothetical protein [Bacillus sp. Marseille-Q3570]|nr:hypothetical protein [Bacillus sp. Marseille-Q3570]